MTLKNIISTLAVLTVFTMSVLSVFTWQPSQVKAESTLSTMQSCPVIGAVWAEFNNMAVTHEVGDGFSEMVSVSNNTSYVIGGVKVAVAVYEVSSDVVPTYWTVLPGSYQLMPNDRTQFPVELSTAALPAGEYVLKVFAMQGDETAVLGAALRDAANTNGMKLVKSTAQSSDVSVSVTINGEELGDQAQVLSKDESIIARIVTKNGDNTPLIDSHMLGVIAQGEVPLGAAVRAEKFESVTLVPGALRITEVRDSYIEGGEYTVYAGLINGEALLPIVAVPIKILDTNDNGPWAYVSRVGLSEYPLQTSSTAIACVEYLGASGNINRFLEPLAVEFTLTAKEGEAVAKKIMSSETGTRDYFSFSPQVASDDFMLVVDFLQERFKGSLIQNEDGSTEMPETLFSVVDVISHSFTCPSSEVCGVKNYDSKFSQVADLVQKSFWFYASIVLAALLLMYLMLLRLEPRTTKPKVKPADKLQ